MLLATEIDRRLSNQPKIVKTIEKQLKTYTE